MQVVAARPVVALAARRVVALARRAAGIIAVPTIDSGQREHAHPTSTAPEYPPGKFLHGVCADWHAGTGPGMARVGLNAAYSLSRRCFADDDAYARAWQQLR